MMSQECFTCDHYKRPVDQAPCSSCSVISLGEHRWVNWVSSRPFVGAADAPGPFAKAFDEIFTACGLGLPFVGDTDAPSIGGASELLNSAAAIMEERGRQYDQSGGERSMAKTVAAFNIMTGNTLSEADGWQFMLTLKAVRLFSVRDKTHEDSVTDLIAYAALLGESAIQKGDLK